MKTTNDYKKQSKNHFSIFNAGVSVIRKSLLTKVGLKFVGLLSLLLQATSVVAHDLTNKELIHDDCKNITNTSVLTPAKSYNADVHGLIIYGLIVLGIGISFALPGIIIGCCETRSQRPNEAAKPMLHH